MADPFGAALLEWHDFFAAVAGVSGTLVGLLFVVIGLNPAIMADTSHAGMRVLAAQTFHSFLVLVLLGLSALVPSDDGFTLMVSLTIIGLQGVVRVVHDVRLARTDPDPEWSGRSAFTRVIAPTLAYVMAIYVAYGIWRQDTSVFDWFVGIVLLLTINAATSCWDLMEVIGKQARKPASGAS
ncbi:MAG: hypothetical protein KC442_01590 [Thermomicrobiales bacterium]|nr:hypothetical protein [Thermomicrobiales bacterium]